MDIHTYFVVERLNIGIGNWSALVSLFDAMGTHDSTLPAHNTHWRTRLDGNAIIYESLYDSEEVSITAFKQLLANEFGVAIDDILHILSNEDYAGYGTTVWVFYYDSIDIGKDRFRVERFAPGGSWNDSREECIAYISTYAQLWEV